MHREEANNGEDWVMGRWEGDNGEHSLCIFIGWPVVILSVVQASDIHHPLQGNRRLFPSLCRRPLPTCLWTCVRGIVISNERNAETVEKAMGFPLIKFRGKDSSSLQPLFEGKLEGQMSGLPI
eukprot:Gb_02991 [translate_table: standard]